MGIMKTYVVNVPAHLIDIISLLVRIPFMWLACILEFLDIFARDTVMSCRYRGGDKRFVGRFTKDCASVLISANENFICGIFSIKTLLDDSGPAE